MVEEKSWEEFREAGMLWWINMILHTFGWAIVFDIEGDKIKRVYPARVKFRGFDERRNTDGYQRVSKFMSHNSAELEKESRE